MKEKKLESVSMQEQVKKMYTECDDQLKTNFKRSLPFQDSLFDRWERAKQLGFGEGTSIYNSACVYDKVIVGRYVWIGPYTLLDGMGGELIIGDYSVISTGVQIYTHDTVLRTLSGGLQPMHHASVRIGNCCHIAPNSVIRAGVEIGNHCLVAINSFVNKSFDDHSIIAGSPARQIGYVEIHPDKTVKLVYKK